MKKGGKIMENETIVENTEEILDLGVEMEDEEIIVEEVNNGEK